jgi:oxygen-independent coproporphyrinogen III oxidase
MTTQFQDSRTLLAKYQGRTPRYTSYPPATAFHEVDSQIVHSAYLNAKESEGPLSLYVHLPFCKSMCRFCGCSAIASPTGKLWTPYLEALKKELTLISSRLERPRVLTQIHWGGGSPNWLSLEETESLFMFIKDLFIIDEKADLSIEIAPQSIHEGALMLLQRLGFNRISFGVQSLDPLVQASIGRVIAKNKMSSLISEAHSLGFKNINIDLMYGLPHQSVQSIEQTLDALIVWRPSRISLFGYAHVPWMKPHQRLLDESLLPNTRERVIQFTHAQAYLEEHGYEHLGLDHFVLPSDSLYQAKRGGTLVRNFQGYDVHRGGDLISVGLSAIAQLGDTYIANSRRLTDYYHHIERGQLPIERVYQRSLSERAIAQSINQVMCHEWLDLKAFSDQVGGQEVLYGEGLQSRIEELIDDELVSLEGDILKVTRLGRLALRHVAAALDPMLRQEETEGARFSSGL